MKVSESTNDEAHKIKETTQFKDLPQGASVYTCRYVYFYSHSKSVPILTASYLKSSMQNIRVAEISGIHFFAKGNVIKMRSDALFIQNEQEAIMGIKTIVQ